MMGDGGWFGHVLSQYSPVILIQRTNHLTRMVPDPNVAFLVPGGDSLRQW